jgi:hypothetical protein
VSNAGWNEEVTWHFLDRIEDGEVLDALLVQQLHEAPPRPALFVL